MDAIETIKNDMFKVEIFVDDNPDNPRIEWDNSGKMVCWHNRYKLGDVGNPFSTTQAAQEYFDEHGSVFLPLYLYDHSGITMKTTEFSDPWDSGQVGYIYIDPENIRKERCIEEITPEVRSKVEASLRAEVETYDMYLTGQVYGYTITDSNSKEVDSCWGFYGLEYAREEAQAALASTIKHAVVTG